MYVVLRCPVSSECFEGVWPEKIRVEDLVEALKQKAIRLGVPIQVEIVEEGRKRVLALSPQGVIFQGALFAPHKVGAAPKKNIKRDL